jgi:hypothetical protein
MSDAQTVEEKEKIEKALSVLYRIQTVSEQTRKAQRAQLEKIANKEEYDHQEFGRLSNAMTETVDAVKQMNGNIQTQRVRMRADFDDVSKVIGDVFEELGTEIDTHRGRMQRALNESALDSQFQLSVLDTKNSRRFNQLNQTVQNTHALSNQHIESLNEGEKTLQGFISTGNQTIDSLATDFVARIETVWRVLNASKARLKTLTADGEAETSRRLRLVQGALSGFSTLWEEYAKVMTRKLQSFRSGDAQFVEALHQRVMTELIGMEKKIKASAEANKQANMNIEQLDQEQDQFEDFVVSKLLDVTKNQNRMNNARSALVTAARKSLVDFENHAKDLDAELKQRVKDELDVFAQREIRKQNALADF